jgi:hypothetical protein
VAVGGDGGTGNTGGAVTVNSHGSITTTGDQADGISAQSIGGGGDGGSAFDYIIGLKSTPGASLNLGLLLGGAGGDTGVGNDVNVTNSERRPRDNQDRAAARRPQPVGFLDESVPERIRAPALRNC